MVRWLRMFSIQGFLTWQSKLLMTYKHLSQAERYQIHALMKAGHDQSQIAKLLDRHKSTISRELSRNTGSRGYRPKQACEMYAVMAKVTNKTSALISSAIVDKLKPMPTSLCISIELKCRDWIRQRLVRSCLSASQCSRTIGYSRPLV